jgi:hypothetical protein
VILALRNSIYIKKEKGGTIIKRFILYSVIMCIILMFTSSAFADPTCPHDWTPDIFALPPDGQGVDGVSALQVFDDGTGESLYAGGVFTMAGDTPANYIAKWDSNSWSALGSGMNSYVHAMAVYDDGNGAALYAGGSFTTAGSVSANYIAKWDGASWSSLSSGVNDRVFALAVYDDGNGPSLYVGGEFTTAGGISTNYIAQWDGQNWSSVGGGTSDDVSALYVFDDGNGKALYAGGRFHAAGGISAHAVAKWDGTSWSPLGNGIGEASPWVGSLCEFDDGSGSALYVGGNFVIVNDIPGYTYNIAKWDGTSWSALGSGVNNSVLDLIVYDDGYGESLYAGGYFSTAGDTSANGVAKWNGTDWSDMNYGVNHDAYEFAIFNDGAGSALYVGGYMYEAGPYGNRIETVGIARWGRQSLLTDFDCDGSVNLVDFGVLADYWMNTGCTIPYGCGGTDVDYSTTVDLADLAILSSLWLLE